MIDWLRHSSVNRYLKLIKDSACSLMPGARRCQGTLPWVCCLQRIILCLKETMNIHSSLLGGIRTEAQIFLLWIVKGESRISSQGLKAQFFKRLVSYSMWVWARPRICRFKWTLPLGLEEMNLLVSNSSSSFHRGWECINNLPLWEALVCLEGSFPFELLWGFCLHARESQSKQ